MPGMDDVEHAVAHDHAAVARPRERAEDLLQLLDRLDLVLVLFGQRAHANCRLVWPPESKLPTFEALIWLILP